MTRQHEERRLDVLQTVARDLTLGNWRPAMTDLSRSDDEFRGDGVDDDERVVRVTLAQRCIARSMRLQCVSSDVEAAWYQLVTAARYLPGGPAPELGPRPAQERRVEVISWATTRLVLREQADLAALRARFEELPRGREEIVNAWVEYLTWVVFDPWTVLVHRDDQRLLGLGDAAYERFRTGNRRDICARATRLRQFADVRRGSVNERTWARVGGCARIQEAALRVLLREPLTRGRADFPVRLGRSRAWEYAQGWGRDIT